MFVFDPVTRVSRQVSPARTEGPTHRTDRAAVRRGGLQGLHDARAFFTTDARLMFRERLDEVLFRVGFGVDF